MSLDRREFLRNAIVIPSALIFPEVSSGMGGLLELSPNQTEQPQAENLPKELADIVEAHHRKIPTYQRRAKTTYGRLAHVRYESEGIPTAYGAASASAFGNQDGVIAQFGPPPPKPSVKYIKDKVQLITPSTSGASIDINILRLPKPILILEKHGDYPPFKLEVYVDLDFNGIPDRAYRGQGVWPHGLPDKYLVDLSKMKADQADYFRQRFPEELRLVISALREYLKLPPQQPLR